MKKCIIPRAMRSIVPRRNNAERGHNGRKWLHESSAGGILCAGGAKPGMAVAGMICGILSIVLCCCSQYITLILAVVGLGLSGYVLAKQKAGTGMAIAGLVCSIFGLLISVCLIIVSLFFVANQNTILKEIQQLSALSGSLKI